jgi:hypothetical protein
LALQFKVLHSVVEEGSLLKLVVCWFQFLDLDLWPQFKKNVTAIHCDDIFISMRLVLLIPTIKQIKYICTLNVKFQFIYWHTNHDYHSTNQFSFTIILYHTIMGTSVSSTSRVPDERFLRICLNGITHTCMIHRWNEENKPHRNKDVVAMYCGHVFFKLRSKVKI